MVFYGKNFTYTDNDSSATYTFKYTYRVHQTFLKNSLVSGTKNIDKNFFEYFFYEK